MLNRLKEIGFHTSTFQRMQDFIYRRANTYAEQHVRLLHAPDSQTRLRWEYERMIPLLEAMEEGVEEVQGRTASLLDELDLRIEGGS